MILRLDFESKTQRNYWTRNLFLLGLVFLLSACIGDDEESSDGNSSSSASTTHIAVSSESVFLSEVGSNFQLTATLKDASGVAFVDQPTFEWFSDSENVVSIDQAGLITAMGLGQASVQVSGAGVTNNVSVTVNADISTLNAVVRYEDKEYGSAGFTNRADYFKAVRFAKVDLIAENGADIEQTTYTDEDGKFSFTGVLTSQQSISVSAQSDESLGLKLRVEDRSSALYSVNKTVNLADLDNFAMDIPVSNKAAGAFNILDVFTNAAQFTMAHSDATLITLSAFWQPNNSDGTYFCTGFDSTYCIQGAGVYIYNSTNGDTDEFDDDVLYHEFGHYFANALSRDDSLGGCHLLSSKDLDLRLAWSEGWGDFLPSGIKSWLSDPSRKHLLSSADNLPITAYVDTYASTAQIYIDMATMSQERYSGAGNEMAVAKILYTLSERFGMSDIVKVLTNYMPAIGNTAVNLESFWDGWLFEHSPSAGDLQTLESIFEERLVFYQEDEYETDGLPSEQRKILMGQVETHYLYQSDLSTDLDVIAFDVQGGNQYTLETLGLTSGADTHIRVLNSGANPLTVSGVLVENDDADENAYYSYDSVCGTSRIKNNGTALSSKVTFTAPSTGTYYAEIRTTTDPEPYSSAGRYGTYDFKISPN